MASDGREFGHCWEVLPAKQGYANAAWDIVPRPRWLVVTPCHVVGIFRVGSKYPLEQLRDAGVDMKKPEPVAAAMQRFKELVDKLETLV